MSLSFDEYIHALTTRIEVKKDKSLILGSGFYYYSYEAEKPNYGNFPDKIWLVTNRHVLLPRIKKEGVELENQPDHVTFFLRIIDDGRFRWEPVELDIGNLIVRARIHSDPKIDVAVVEVRDLLAPKMHPKEGPGAEPIFGLDKRNLPANNPLTPGLGDEALVIGYPSGYYDQFNLYPIVKSGVIASGWGYQFEGFPAFLIDAKLFPGSSGSLVISRPIDLANIEGEIKISKKKQYLFLGVFSAEPFISETAIELDDITIIRKSGLNTGLVWYGDLVEEIIEKGTSIKNIKSEQ